MSKIKQMSLYRDGQWQDPVDIGAAAVNVDIDDKGNLFTAENVEDALVELKNNINSANQAASAATQAAGNATQTANTANSNATTVMTGATASAAGTSGRVPTPPQGSQNKFLRGDATWATMSNIVVTDTEPTSAETGTVWFEVGE